MIRTFWSRDMRQDVCTNSTKTFIPGSVAFNEGSAAGNWRWPNKQINCQQRRNKQSRKDHTHWWKQIGSCSHGWKFYRNRWKTRWGRQKKVQLHARKAFPSLGTCPTSMDSLSSPEWTNQLQSTLGSQPYCQNLADLRGHVGAAKMHFVLYILDNDWNDDLHGQFEDHPIQG